MDEEWKSDLCAEVKSYTYINTRTHTNTCKCLGTHIAVDAVWKIKCCYMVKFSGFMHAWVDSDEHSTGRLMAWENEITQTLANNNISAEKTIYFQYDTVYLEYAHKFGVYFWYMFVCMYAWFYGFLWMFKSNNSCGWYYTFKSG